MQLILSNPTNTADKTAILCDGTTKVTLGFDAEAAIQTKPIDLILLIDRSGSIGSTNMATVREAAKKFVDTVAQVSGCVPGETIGAGNRIGLCSFTDRATKDVALTADVPVLMGAIDKLRSDGKTRFINAFNTAETMFEDTSENQRVIVMFTDGAVGPYETVTSVATVTDRIKKTGIEIYCTGKVEDPAGLIKWASEPEEQYVSYTKEWPELVAMFEKTALKASGGYLDHAVITEELSQDFEIVKADTPSCGTVIVRPPRTLVWTLDAVGSRPTLSFEVVHVGTKSGKKDIDKEVIYKDDSETELLFPHAAVQVDCPDVTTFPEPCPDPTTVDVEGCVDSKVVNAGAVSLSSLGRIVQVDVLVRHVCPGRRAAAAVILTEVDNHGNEYARGMKTILLPPVTGTECQNVLLKCIDFVVPEVLDVKGQPDSICNDRTFRTRVIANYIDTDFVCCDNAVTIL